MAIKYRSSFTMIELVFVIVILGALAGTASTWLIQTRSDSQIAMIRSDIATILKQVPARVIAENVAIKTTPPTGYQSWGDWLMDTPSLDKSRWKPTQNGLVAIAASSSSSKEQSDIVCKGNYIELNLTNGVLTFTPEKIEYTNTFCKLLANSYPSNSTRTIALVTSGSTRF